VRRTDVTVYGDGLEQATVALRSVAAGTDRLDVIYVHGSTFGCECSVFFPMDGRSWADALLEAGFNVWGFDFLGYGSSSRYPEGTQPRGRVNEASMQLRAVVADVRRCNGERPVVLLAHSWGCAVAAHAAGLSADGIAGLVLFGPVAPRMGATLAEPSAPAFADWSVWAQYRRIIEGVPRDEASVLADRHFDHWARRYLASDEQSASREPPAVRVPAGPVVDIAALWSGVASLDPAPIHQPTLLVRGEWDTVCDMADIQWWFSAIGSDVKHIETLLRGTHLMHLESGRESLYAACNRFLLETQA
jgi:pimeloyl-ACP methyl ester carboxylesterase